MRSRLLLLAVCMWLLTVLAAGCSAAGKGVLQPRSPAPSKQHGGTAHQYVTIDGKRLLVPTERGTRPIQAEEDAGEQIIITTHGFRPELLFAEEELPVTFTNLTLEPQRINFTNTQPTVRSPVIPPGGRWTYTPSHAMNFTYASSHGSSGQFYAAPAP